VVGCPTTPASQLPVQVPDQVDPVASDECISFRGLIDSGASGVPMASHAPEFGRFLAARCDDESVCTAEIAKDGLSVLVRGKAPGHAFVVVTYEHPETHERGDKKVGVTITVPPPSDPLHPRVVGAHPCPKPETGMGPGSGSF